MAKVMMSLCDVMLAQGKEVPATHRETLRVPGQVMEIIEPENGRKAKIIDLDVSEQGLRVLEQKREKFRRLISEAAEVYLELAEARAQGKQKVSGKKPGKRSGKDESSNESPESEEDSEASVTAETPAEVVEA